MIDSTQTLTPEPLDADAALAALDPELAVGGDGPSTAEQAAEDAKSREVAARHGLEYVDVRNFRIQNDLFRRVPFDLMLRYGFIPEAMRGGRMAVVMGDPTDVRKIDELELLLGHPLDVKMGTPAAIAEILQKSESAQRVLDEATEDFRIQLVQDDEGEEVLSLGSITQDQSPIIKLVDSTIFNAIQRRASDVHIETGDHQVIIKYRIDGALYQAMDAIDKRHHQTIISRIKVMSELDISEKRVPQDGRFKLRLKGRTIDFRVSILPTVHGEDCVIRVLDKESMNKEFKNLSLTVLGIDEETIRKLRRSIREPYGMVLVTGPTGSGKTTTLYSALSRVNTPEVNIMTAEDPVEYNLMGINQVLVRNEVGMTFAAALKAFLRQDPNIIMVGEIRDIETGGIAIKAALTGHLVLSTLHTNDAPSTITRMIDMGIEPFNVASAVNLIVAQRLVRRICKDCKQEHQYSKEELKALGLTPADVTGITFYKGSGCDTCNSTGYKGRAGLYEVMALSPELRRQILRGCSAAELQEQAVKEGMLTLRMDGIEKIKKGITSLEEVVKETAG
ncbi:MAG TPA: ATPase, T2SS/T4P/T4SS family [Thermoanaerobaculia bacterium]